MSQCVTGRLETLEEIVDWQPYDHIGYRLVVPDVGPVLATYDLRESDAGTTVRLRWAADGDQPSAEAAKRIEGEKRAALDQLATLLGT
jgi:hypothetical protein